MKRDCLHKATKFILFSLQNKMYKQSTSKKRKNVEII